MLDRDGVKAFCTLTPYSFQLSGPPELLVRLLTAEAGVKELEAKMAGKFLLTPRISRRGEWIIAKTGGDPVQSVFGKSMDQVMADLQTKLDPSLSAAPQDGEKGEDAL